jgi:hypothetical protein
VAVTLFAAWWKIVFMMRQRGTKFEIYIVHAMSGYMMSGVGIDLVPS